MEINFNAGTLTVSQARGLVALLVATHGRDVLPETPTVVMGRVEVDASQAAQAMRDVLAEREAAMADDGSEPEPVTTAAPPAKDSAGLPWDERIHSSSKATNADGTWRYRKGVGADTKAAVEAELRGPQAPAVTEEPPPPPAPADVAAAFPVPPSSTAPTAPPPPPAAPASPAPAVTADFNGFVQLIQYAGKLQTDGKATLEQVVALAKQYGESNGLSVAQPSDFRADANLPHIPVFFTLLQSAFGA